MIKRKIARAIRRPAVRSILPQASGRFPANVVTFDGKPVTFMGQYVQFGGSK